VLRTSGGVLVWAGDGRDLYRAMDVFFASLRLPQSSGLVKSRRMDGRAAGQPRDFWGFHASFETPSWGTGTWTCEALSSGMARSSTGDELGTVSTLAGL
jgi:hypothetical protein